MTSVYKITAAARDRAGKGSARSARRNGDIPAVIYGNKETPVLISLSNRAMHKHLQQPTFYTHLFDIEVNGKTTRVLPRDVQFHPVSDAPLHIDFLRVTESTEIEVEVPLAFIGQDKSPGMKRGGVLNVVLHEVPVICRASNIPEKIEIDISQMNVGDSVQVKNLTLPKGAKIALEDENATLANIVAPAAVVSAEMTTADAPAKA